MPAAPTAPPTAASPTPAPAPKTSTPTAPAAPAPHSSGETRFNDAFAEIDQLMGEPEVEKEGKEKSTPGKDEAPPEKATATPADKEAPKTTGTEKPPEAPSTPKQLRTAYEQATKRLKELEGKLAEREATKPTEDPEKKALADRLAEVQKKTDQLEEELRFSAYERSDDYKSRYLRPLEDAFKSSYEEVAQLTITDGEGKETKATPEHFNALLRLPIAQAIVQAKEWFGDAATEVLAMRRNIVQLNSARQTAVDQFRTEGAERTKRFAEQTAKQQDEIRSLWRQNVDEGIEKHPQLFKASDDDAKGKELLTKGMQLAEYAFTGAHQLPPSERVKLHAAIRNKAGGFDYVVYQNRKLAAENKELRDKLSDYEKSEPGAGEGRRPAAGKAIGWAEEIEALAQEGS